MTRDEWQYSSSLFRELLGKLEEGNFNRRVKYRFGLQFNPMFGFYHLWDGLGRDEEHKEPLTVATIRLRPKLVTIRHLPTFLFKDELMKFKLSDRKSIFLPSENVVRHDNWAHPRIQSRVERRVQERRAFLEREQQRLDLPPFTLTISYPTRTASGLSGLTATQSGQMQVRVVFSSQEQMERHGREAQEMVERLVNQYGTILSDNHIFPIEELFDIFRREQRRYDDQHRAEEAMMRTLSARQNQMYNAYYNADAQTYYGRPMQQIQEYMSTTTSASTAMNEESIMQAVSALDEMNVPRQENSLREWARRRGIDV